MRMKFISDSKCLLSKMEYCGLWNQYGDVILAAFEKVTGLQFNEKVISAIVGEYPSNFAGSSLDEPMLFRNSVRHKIGTFFHELSHRLLLEYPFNYEGILENDHELIDLFLFDVIKEAFGIDAANERVNYELTFPETEITFAWKKMLKYSELERHIIWDSVLKKSRIGS